MKEKIVFLITLILLFSSCMDRRDKNQNANIVKTNKGSEKLKKKETSCVLGYEELDTLSKWQSRTINPEKQEEGYLMLSAHITSTDNNYGIITYLNTSDSIPTLFLVKSVDNSNNYLVLGTKTLDKLKSNQSIVSMCSSDCEIYSSITGVISFDKENSTKTIKVWSIDKENGRLIKLDKDRIDCTNAFNAEYN